MANIQVLTITKRDSTLFNGVLAKHNRREKIPDYSRPQPGLDRCEVIFQDRERGDRLLQMIKDAPKRRGRKGHVGVELVIQAAPPYGPKGAPNPERWTKAKVDAFYRDSVRWIQDCLENAPDGPAGVLVEANLHQDERSPHAHASIIPATEDNPYPKKERVDRALAGGETSKSYSDVGAAMHDHFHRCVAAKYGVARGQRRKKPRKHAEPDHVKGLMDDLADAGAFAAAADRNAAGAQEDARVFLGWLKAAEEERDIEKKLKEQALADKEAEAERAERAMADAQASERAQVEHRAVAEAATRRADSAEAGRDEAEEREATAERRRLASSGAVAMSQASESVVAGSLAAVVDAARAAERSAFARDLEAERDRRLKAEARAAARPAVPERKPAPARRDGPPGFVPRGGERSGQGGQFVPRGGGRSR